MDSYFYPQSQQERINAIHDYIVQMNQIQERVSKSIIAKYFVDYREDILEHQKELSERQNKYENDENYVSFSTFKLHHVIASPGFPKEQLMQLACLIDESFQEDVDTALFIIDLENDHIVMDIAFYNDDNSFERKRFQKFVSQVSKNIFKEEPVTLRVGTPDSDTDEIFKVHRKSAYLYD